MTARLLRLFAASVVPGGGFLLAGWSPATALTLYWVDNLIGGLAMTARIALHRRATGTAGHRRLHLNAVATVSSRGQATSVKFSSFLVEFLTMSTVFTLAHGVFLAALLGFVLERPDLDGVRQGAMAIVVCQVLALWFDSLHLDGWTFAQLKLQALRLMGRIVLVHLALIGGTWFFAMRSTPGAFFSVFVSLKFLTDIGNLLPQFDPREPPRWMASVMKRFPRQKGESFEEYWRRTRKQDDDQAAEDERRVE